MKRQRGRGRRPGSGNYNPNKHFESNGPDVKIRGSAQQILDKYQQYARDALSSGDRIHAENYLQHAEHYYRLLSDMQQREKQSRPDKPDQVSEATARPRDGAEEEGAPQSDASADVKQKDAEQSSARPRRRPYKKEARDSEPSPASDVKAEDTAPEKTDKVTGPDTEMSDAVEKPKRRRTYKPRQPKETTSQDVTSQDVTSQDDNVEGVMKTLSRGQAEMNLSPGDDVKTDRPAEAIAKPIAEPTQDAS